MKNNRTAYIYEDTKNKILDIYLPEDAKAKDIADIVNACGHASHGYSFIRLWLDTSDMLSDDSRFDEYDEETCTRKRYVTPPLEFICDEGLITTYFTCTVAVPIKLSEFEKIPSYEIAEWLRLGKLDNKEVDVTFFLETDADVDSL